MRGKAPLNPPSATLLRARQPARLVGVLGLLAAAGCDSCGAPPTPPTSEPAPHSLSVVEAAGPPDVQSDNPAAVVPEVKGTGWYPNIEADAAGRLHLAWVDADRGDVRYAVTAPGGAAVETIITVDDRGAAGAFLSLGIAPGGAPLLSYSRQDTQIFHLAWRPGDREAMQAAGADVSLLPMPRFPTENKVGAPVELKEGFVAEELGFGDQVGRGSSFAVDAAGRFALAYYTADDRLRLVRRPSDVTAFGPDSIGVLEKRDLDSFARGSARVVSDTAILTDGTVVVAYAHDVATDARLRVAVLAPDGSRPKSDQDDAGDTFTVDGLTARLFITEPAADGQGAGEPIIDVVAHDRHERAVIARRFDLHSGTFLGPRRTLLRVEGTAVAAQGAQSTFILARVPGKEGGVFLYVVDEGAKHPPPVEGAAAVRRIRLSGPTKQDDAWLDVVVRQDDRPAAVWYDADQKAIRLYAP